MPSATCFSIGTRKSDLQERLVAFAAEDWPAQAVALPPCHAATSAVIRGAFVGAPYKTDRAVLAGWFLQRCQDSGSALCTHWL